MGEEWKEYRNVSISNCPASDFTSTSRSRDRDVDCPSPPTVPVGPAWPQEVQWMPGQWARPLPGRWVKWVSAHSTPEPTAGIQLKKLRPTAPNSDTHASVTGDDNRARLEALKDDGKVGQFQPSTASRIHPYNPSIHSSIHHHP